MSAPLRAAAAAAMFLLAGAGAMAFAQDAGQSASATQGAGQSAALTLTVDQAMARALANQPLIQQAQAAVEAARARVGEANSAYYPFLNGTASYNRLSDESFALGALLPPAAELSQFGITIPPSFAPLLNAPFSFAPVNSWDFKLGLNQVIFQFGKRGIQVKLAENGVSAAEIGVEQIRSSLAFQAAQGFYTVLFLKQQLAALDTQLANLQEHLDAVRVRTQTGAATRYDELSTEVRITALQSQRIDADNMLNKQAVGLKLLLGIEENTQLDLSGDFTPGAAASRDEQAQVAAALSRRPEIRQAVEAERAAELSRRLSTMGGWPTISGHASVGYSNGILPDLNTPVLNWVAGVQVNVPIFQGFLVARQGEEADKRLLAARQNTMQVERTITTQVLQALQDIDAGRRQVESAQAQLGQAKEMLDVVKLQYDLGMLTNLEYLDAQASLERAQLASLQSQYRQVLNRYALDLATGASFWLMGPEATGK